MDEAYVRRKVGTSLAMWQLITFEFAEFRDRDLRIFMTYSRQAC